MKWLPNCFMLDLSARGERIPTIIGICRLLIFDLGYRTVVYYRIAIRLSSLSGKWWWLARFIGALIMVHLSRSPGVEIHCQKEIGPGLSFPHPHNIVIGKHAIIGRNCTIFNGVTVGALGSRSEAGSEAEGYPVIGDSVILYAGSKVLGPVFIGDNSIIGANAVVLQSFPKGSVLVGIPAKKSNNSSTIDNTS